MEKPKPIIIGQAPARGNDGKLPFAGRSGSRLATLAGVGSSGDDIPNYFTLINLLDHYPGKEGKGDAFDMALATQAARKLTVELKAMRRTRILMMGKKVRRAMGVQGQWEYLEWFDFGPHRATVFPHPSGVNRWWNDRHNVDRAELFLHRLLDKV
jgi:uracil-DNA glycosylase